MVHFFNPILFYFFVFIGEWRIKKTRKDSRQMQTTQIQTVTIIITYHRKRIIMLITLDWVSVCIIIHQRCTISDLITLHRRLYHLRRDQQQQQLSTLLRQIIIYSIIFIIIIIQLHTNIRQISLATNAVGDSCCHTL